jgi:murein DD-endopeptidase MepM/ murein hydrolase activator NlpD
MRPSRLTLLILGVMLYCSPQFVFAATGNYTSPLSATATTGHINSYFDHTSPQYGSDSSSTMTLYDGSRFTTNVDLSNCTPSTHCYNGHNGLDYNTKSMEGKDILAAAAGIVRQVGWDSPSNHNLRFGYFVSLYHSAYNQTTLYAHTTSSKVIVAVGNNVTRSQKIAVSGATGSAGTPTWQPHLHFSVYDGDVMATSAFAFSLDPQGWLGSGQDPSLLIHCQE